jgi:hypothetical protein
MNSILRLITAALVALFIANFSTDAAEKESGQHRRLYVAVPGIRNYLEYGGHGLLIFDIDNGHKFLKRIKTLGLDDKGQPLNVKGVCANAGTKRIYISTTRTLTCLDLVTEKIIWEKAYPGGCDRMSMSPDGKVIYAPSLEGAHWHVINAISGDVITKIVPSSGAHNTVYGLDGQRVYLAGLKSPLLTIADTSTHTSNNVCGPFSNFIRPFTINGSQTLAFCCINDLLGFEIGDLKTGKMLHRVEIQGFQKGAIKRHGCPSHGIGLTPDEKEIWVTDAHNRRLHIYDGTVMPPKYLANVELRDEPGWITFGISGQYAYPATGDVIEIATRKIVTGLTDENGAAVQSEKLLEIDFKDGQPVRAGDQFGIGQVRKLAVK